MLNIFMSWFFIVISAHLLNAGSVLVTKFLLVKAIPKAVVFTFWISVLGLIAVTLLPFGYVRPSASQLVLAFFAGATFDLALLAFFGALRWLETSRVVPVVGGVQPLLILLFSFLFLGERLTSLQMTGIAALVLGTALISIDTTDATPSEAIKRHRGWLYATLATFFFAVTYTATKAVFDTQPFISGFVWIRIGAFVFVLLFLLRPTWRRAIFSNDQKSRTQFGALFVAGQVMGAVGAILLQYAISLASVTIVTAMQGVQYVFLFALAVVLGRRFTVLRERLNTGTIVRKIAAIVCIGAGLVFIV